MDDLRPRRPGRFVLRALAIASALGFLALLMVQAMAFYAPTPEAPKTRTELLAPPTKDAPVFLPSPPPDEPLDLFPATKAGTLGRLWPSPPAPPPQPVRMPFRDARMP
jgi:hypothetical protein